MWVGPKFSDKCLYKRHTEDRHRGKYRGAEGNVKVEAETGKMQSEECRPSPEAGRRQGMETPQEPLDGSWPCQHHEFGVFSRTEKR